MLLEGRRADEKGFESGKKYLIEGRLQCIVVEGPGWYLFSTFFKVKIVSSYYLAA